MAPPTAMTSTFVMSPRIAAKSLRSYAPVTGRSVRRTLSSAASRQRWRRSSAATHRSPAPRGRVFLRRRPPIVLARLRGGRVDRRTTVLALKTARKASLTAADVGNAAATSGCSATSVVPLRRPAYLPRTPRPSSARSYSGRRSPGTRRLPFFIGAALTARGLSGRD
jgi:hypothetical protein